MHIISTHLSCSSLTTQVLLSSSPRHATCGAGRTKALHSQDLPWKGNNDKY